jgi:hypothetical protein
VPIESTIGLLALRGFEIAQVRRPTVGETTGGGLLVALPAMGSLARRSKVDQLSHLRPVL